MSSNLRMAVISEHGQLRKSVEEQLEEFSADAGFIAYLAHKFDVNFEWTVDEDIRSFKYPRQFSGYGYVIALDPSSETSAYWGSCVERELVGRSFVVADRSTFIYQPLEVFGLALGLDAISHGKGMAWLAQQIRSQEIDESVSGLFLSAALHVVEKSTDSAFVWRGKDWLSACYYYILARLLGFKGSDSDVHRAESIILQGLTEGSVAHRDRLSRSVVFFTVQQILNESLCEHLADDGSANRLIQQLQEEKQNLEKIVTADQAFQKYYWSRYARRFVFLFRVALSVIFVGYGILWLLVPDLVHFDGTHLHWLNRFNGIIPFMFSVLAVLGLNWSNVREKLFGAIIGKIAVDRRARYMELKKHWFVESGKPPTETLSRIGSEKK